MPVRERLKTARPRAQFQQGRNDWYKIRNFANGTAEVAIYDEIGFWGVTASDFLRDLREVNALEITLRLNSPGGEIFDGIAIMNALRAHPARVTTHVDSLAASIASVIALAGDRVIMQPHSQMMIHDGSGLVIGNASDMREMADLLDRQSNNIAEVYAEKAGGTVEQWRERMLAETWYTAKEAVAAGLADEVAEPKRRPDEKEPTGPDRPDSSWDLSVFRYPSRAAAPAPRLADQATDSPDNVSVADGQVSPDTQDGASVEDKAEDPPEQLADTASADAQSTPAATEAEPAPIDTAAATEAVVPADDWTSLTAHLHETAPLNSPDGWAALVHRLTDHTASSSAATEAA